MLNETRVIKKIWLIGKFGGETVIGRNCKRQGKVKLSGILSSGRPVLIPIEKVVGLKKLKFNSKPSPYSITTEWQDSDGKSEKEQGIENLLKHLNTY